MPERFCVVFISAPAGRVAQRLATSVLRARLAACVSVIPTAVSHYWWKGKLENGRESLLIVKTRRSLLARLEKHVHANHPYEVPEVISLPVLTGNKAYLQWLADETRARL